MDATFVVSAIIFTLLAVVVATSLFNGSSSSSSGDFANTDFSRPTGERPDTGTGQSEPQQNGHVPGKKKKEEEADDWCELSGSSHDHWDVVKSVQSADARPNAYSEELATAVEHLPSSSRLSSHRPASRAASLDMDTSAEAPSGRGCTSIIGLSDQQLLKCAFSHPQTEGAAESPASNDKMESNAHSSLKYVPGKTRSHHLQMMMSKDELEEEQRIHFNTDCRCV
ncbi:uncharacterized protein LOC117530899 isoform X2 [Thalassophryne amazonica]|uniref:uncharacterized protein LOC117530899 isoform X2 n=1 Tax=Thalassophryne amazonica TaxID=390379 RepID=UPI0014725DDF|nr:uncharacterized protein LOC117530899 isoform X2 [Thalassophryne amazonica]